MLTVPKEMGSDRFSEYTRLVQRSAIRSWSRVAPDQTVVFSTDELTQRELCEAHGHTCVRKLRTTAEGAPLLDSVLQRALAGDLSTTAESTGVAARRASLQDTFFLLCNADIIFPPHSEQVLEQLLHAIRHRYSRQRGVLVVGQRLSLSLNDSEVVRAATDPSWTVLPEHAASHDGEWAIDYWLFNSALFARMPVPPLAIGRPGVDNVLVWEALNSGAAVVDASRVLAVHHPRHPHEHLNVYNIPGRFTTYGPDERYNREIALCTKPTWSEWGRRKCYQHGRKRRRYKWATLNDTTHIAQFCGQAEASEQWIHSIWQPSLGHQHSICLYDRNELYHLTWISVLLAVSLLMVVIFRCTRMRKLVKKL